MSVATCGPRPEARTTRNVTVLRAYAPTERPEDQARSLAALATLPDDWRVVHWRCDGPLDYADAVRACWPGGDELVIVEHDNAPTLAQLRSMVECPEPVCTCLYWMGPASSRRWEHVLSGGDPGTEPADVGIPDRVQHSGIGCVKLSAGWRRSVTPPDRVIWFDIEGSLNKRVTGGWHVHWPLCEHAH